MRLRAHLDPHTLEAHLLQAVAAAKQADPLADVLVIVPTKRVADHVARRIGERLGAVLGVEILFHRALAARILEDAGRTPPVPAGRLLLEALLDEVLRDLEERNALASFVRARAGASASLLGSLVELREAGCTPEAVRSGATTGRQRDLAAIYEFYARRLGSLRGYGLADDAALAAEAVDHAKPFAERFVRILHHGAYELVGINLDVVRALDHGREVEFLAPIAAGRPVSAYAEDFARDFLLPLGGRIENSLLPLGGRIEALDAGFASLLGNRLVALYDEAARPDPLPDDLWSLVNAQGTATEYTWALRRAAARVADGAPAHESALIARTWSPYAATIAETLEPGALTCDASPGTPLRREPLVRDTIAALRVVADDFPRAATAELLRSPRISWESPGAGASHPVRAEWISSGAGPRRDDTAPVHGGLAESWSREAGIVRGLVAWTNDLPAWAVSIRAPNDASTDELARQVKEAEERGVIARRIATAVAGLAALVDPSVRRSWGAHADATDGFIAGLYTDPTRVANATRLIAPALDAARDRQRVLGDTAPVPFATFVAWMEHAADTLTSDSQARQGAVAVVDAMQARGTTFAHVHLAGLQAGLLPRIPREDAFIDDAFRRRLRETTGRPLPTKLDGDREERLLLALTLGAAGERLDMSWPRADDDGRAKVASPALREIARVLLGAPDAAELRRRAFAIPSHPRDRFAAIADGTGLLTPFEEATFVALQAEGRSEGRAALISRNPRLQPGLDLVAATESFVSMNDSYDGRVTPPGDRAWSVTALETLGRCALQFFFRDVLRVRPLVEEPSAFAASAREVGERVHALLQAVYAALLAEGGFAWRDPARLAARGDALVTELWHETIGASSERIARTLPALHEIQTRTWMEAVRRFVTEDLLLLHREGAAPVALEELASGTIDAGDGVIVKVRGRFDRVVRSETKAVVGDYKTAGNLEKRVDPLTLLRGERLQVPLYRELANGAAVVLLGVGPSFDPAPEALEARRASFDGFDDRARAARQEEGFRETLRVLLRMPTRGSFPIRPGRHCSYCDWRAACRHNHPPTIVRHETAADSAEYRLLEKKTKAKPLLVDHAPDSANGDAA